MSIRRRWIRRQQQKVLEATEIDRQRSDQADEHLMVTHNMKDAIVTWKPSDHDA